MANNLSCSEISPLLNQQRRHGEKRIAKEVITAFALCTFLIVFSLYQAFSKNDDFASSFDYVSRGSEWEAISPTAHPEITERNVERLFKSVEFRELSARRLSGAVQIPTEVFDDMGAIGEDDRWDVFFDFSRHEKLELESVNTHGLAYTWHGSNLSLEPILLTERQDVNHVAEDAQHQRKHPQFSGHFDGAYIYGRGTHENKSNIVAMLASITELLKAGFVPRRTVMLHFGLNVESSTNKLSGCQTGQELKEAVDQETFAIVLNPDHGCLEANPALVDESSSWKYLSGVIEHVFDGEGDGTVPTASIVQSASDSKYYQDISEHTYQFSPLRSGYDHSNGFSQIVDERVSSASMAVIPLTIQISIDAHMESILFYHEFIRVFDEANE